MTTTPTPEIVPGAETASSTATELAGLRSEVAGGLSPATNEALAMGGICNSPSRSIRTYLRRYENDNYRQKPLL